MCSHEYLERIGIPISGYQTWICICGRRPKALAEYELSDVRAFMLAKDQLKRPDTAVERLQN
jgi:hypothetical protein